LGGGKLIFSRTIYFGRLIILLAVFGFISSNTTLGFSTALMSVAYDGSNQARITSDGNLSWAVSYDSAAMPVTSDKESCASEAGGIFARFADFLTAGSRLAPFMNCFPVGTLVLMADGWSKPIEESVDWPLRETVFHVFAKRKSIGFEFRYIRG
jgi:hypothetical protein